MVDLVVLGEVDVRRRCGHGIDAGSGRFLDERLCGAEPCGDELRIVASFEQEPIDGVDEAWKVMQEEEVMRL